MPKQITEHIKIAALHNGVTVVDADTSNWGDPKTDQSLYNIAVIKSDLCTIEQRHIGNFRVSLPKDTIVFVRPGEVEQVYNDQPPGENVTLTSVLFDHSLAKNIFGDEHLDGCRGVVDPVATKLLDALAMMSADSDPLLVDHLTMALLHRMRGERCNPEVKCSDRIARSISYISERLDRKMTLAEIAGAAAMSEFHFLRTFREVTGMTPLAYVTAKRIERAKALIIRAKFPMGAIALMCGFSSQSHFSSAFKAHTGHTPREYQLGTGARTVLDTG